VQRSSSLDKRVTKSVEKVLFDGHRLTIAKLNGKPVDICIIQVYMPQRKTS